MSTRDLASAVAAALQDARDAPLWIAFSGGLDSTALLHAAASSPAVRARGVQALHVDHQLHADAPRWSAHCRALCEHLGVPLTVQRVDVDRASGRGLEAAAREARYSAFARVLPAGHVLALAHHRDDQIETLLLRLLRGSGGAALAGMARWRPLAEGVLWRPLLELPRAMLREYATTHALPWIDDPANTDPRHDRSVLRHELLPRLRARWPGADVAVARSARLLAEDAARLHAVDCVLLAQVQGVDPATLSLPAFAALAASERRAVLRLWLRELALPAPPAAVIDRLDGELLGARGDGAACLRWAGAELRRHRDNLFAMRPLAAPQASWSVSWDGCEAIELPSGFGTLTLESVAGERMPCGAVTLRPRRGGETMELPGAGRRRPLKHVLQELGVPPWVRQRLPLVFGSDGELLAAGDLVIGRHWTAQCGSARLRWTSAAC